MARVLRRCSVAALALAGLAVATRPAAGHVEYTDRPGEHVSTADLLGDTLGDPLNVGLLLGGATLVVLAVAVYLRFQPLRRDVAVFRNAVANYRDLLPWLLRLSFGLPLIGAGFAGYFVSPAVEPSGEVLVVAARLFQIGLGFALLFGLATRAAAAVGLLVYLAMVPLAPRLLLSMEYVPGLLAIVLIGSGRPSADDVLETLASAEGTVYSTVDPVHRLSGRFRDVVAPYHAFVPTVVRVGLGLNFVYLGLVEKLLAPGSALSVVAKYDLTDVVPVDAGLWVVGAGVTEIAVGLALIVGAFTRASSLTALLLFTLTLFALPDDPVLAHISLFGLASTLLVTGPGPYSLDSWIARQSWTPGAGGETASDGLASIGE